MSAKWRLVGVFLIIWGVLQAAYWSGTHYKQAALHARFISSIETRIALDLPKLELANPKFGIVAHNASVRDYLSAINDSLISLDSPIRVAKLQDIEVLSGAETDTIVRTLDTADRQVTLMLLTMPGHWREYFSFLALALAVLLTYVSRSLFASNKQIEQQQDLDEVVLQAQARLIINLHNKTIRNGLDDIAVALPNKPFCFYAALVDYCLQQESPKLNHNKEVPEELILLANKYFYRLIELGHTKRKRPDFGTNLDKTLSEIRSALDEVFHDYADAKDIFYPPKAQGEGSRSKIHNYALERITAEQVEIFGK